LFQQENRKKNDQEGRARILRLIEKKRNPGLLPRETFRPGSDGVVGKEGNGSKKKK